MYTAVEVVVDHKGLVAVRREVEVDMMALAAVLVVVELEVVQLAVGVGGESRRFLG